MVFKKTLNKNRPKGRKGKRRWQDSEEEAMAEEGAMETIKTRQLAGTADVKSGGRCGIGVVIQCTKDATTSAVKISSPGGS